MLRKNLLDILDFSSYLASLCMGIILIASAPSQKDNIGMAVCVFFGFNILCYMYKSEELRK